MELLQDVTGLEYRLLKTVYSRFPVYRFEKVIKDVPAPAEIGWRKKLEIIKSLTAGEPTPGIDMTDYDRGEVKRAVKETRKLCRLNRYDTNGLFYLGALLIHTGLREEADLVFRKILALDSSFRDTRLMIARHLIQTGEIGEASDLIDEEIGMFGKSMETAYYSGMLLRKSGEEERAVKVLKEGLALYGGDEPLRAATAIEIADMEKDDLSKSETLRNFHASEPDNEPLKYGLASRLVSTGDTDEAKKLFGEIAERCKTREITGAAWYRLALLSEPDERAEMLENCLRLNPGHIAASESLKKLEREKAGA
jgi:tetratricopeptide (TPR) repeat protein